MLAQYLRRDGAQVSIDGVTLGFSLDGSQKGMIQRSDAFPLIVEIIGGVAAQAYEVGLVCRLFGGQGDVYKRQTFYHVSQYLCPDLSDEKQVPRPLAEHFEKGEFGVKAKKGFYDYGDGKDEEAIKNRDASFIKLYNALYK